MPVNAARHLPQVVHDPDPPLGDVCQLGAEVDVLGRDRRLHGSKREREWDELLLSAIVQVALDPPACLVRGGNHAGPGGRQLCEVLGLGDHSRDKLCERSQTCSVSRGNGCSSTEQTIMAPQTRPWTMIGAPAAGRKPAAAAAPAASA